MKKLLKLGAVGAMLLSGQAFAQCDTTFSAWDSVSNGANPANQISTTDVNPLEGACSLSVPLELAGKRYVQDDHDAQESSFRMAFKIDPSSVSMPTTGQDRRVKVASVLCVDGGNGCGVDADGNTNFAGVWQTKLRQQDTGYKLGSWVQETTGNRISHTVNLNDECNSVEIQIIAGNPGTYRMWVNNDVEASPDFESTIADLSGKFVDRVRFGKTATGANVIGPGKSFLLDSYESRRQTFIGNLCN